MNISAVLTDAQRKAGLELHEDPTFLFLARGGSVLATFSGAGATKESIRKEADKYIKPMPDAFEDWPTGCR